MTVRRVVRNGVLRLEARLERRHFARLCRPRGSVPRSPRRCSSVFRSRAGNGARFRRGGDDLKALAMQRGASGRRAASSATGVHAVYCSRRKHRTRATKCCRMMGGRPVGRHRGVRGSLASSGDEADLRSVQNRSDGKVGLSPMEDSAHADGARMPVAAVQSGDLLGWEVSDTLSLSSISAGRCPRVVEL
jgi:hypothetical protein